MSEENHDHYMCGVQMSTRGIVAFRHTEKNAHGQRKKQVLRLDFLDF